MKEKEAIEIEKLQLSNPLIPQSVYIRGQLD